MSVNVSSPRAGRKGQVRAVRELATRGVQAEVCLGASVTHGYAAITIESSSPEAREALEALKDVLRREAFDLTEKIIEDQRQFDIERERRHG